MEGIEKLNAPNLKVFKEFQTVLREADSIEYQFYEQFGFTDVCRHYRALGRPKETSFLKKGRWLKLPLSAKFIEKINLLDAKNDPIPNKKAFNPFYLMYQEYADIRLSAFVYSQFDKSFTLDLNKGYYRFDEHMFCVYDEESGFFYEEYHKCP
jgi:hypothetical protein